MTAADHTLDTNTRRCLVTGGAGFIGSHLVDHLVSAGHSVVVVDDLSTGRLSNLDPARSSIRFIEAPLHEALADPIAGDRFDEIYHLAAAVGVRRVVEFPIDSIESNVAETAALLRYALSHARAHDRPARVLFASSSEVYGKSTHSPFAETDDCLYGPTTARRWSYAASKALGEHLALAHHERHALPVVIARLFNTVGPRQVGDYGMVLPRFIGAALEGVPIKVHGDGAQTRCFCDVRDVVPALPRLIAPPACTGKVFNLGSDQPISIMALARLVNQTLGSDAGIRTVPYDEAFGPGFEDLLQRKPDLTRIRRAIGFDRRIPLSRTILDVADEMRTKAASSAECNTNRS